MGLVVAREEVIILIERSEPEGERGHPVSLRFGPREREKERESSLERKGDRDERSTS